LWEESYVPQPTIPALAYNFQSELGTPFGTHLDDNFDTLVSSVTQAIQQQALLQRDDGWIRSQSVTADSFEASALALMAGSAQADSSLDWRPRGDWITATLYSVGNIVETGSPATAYVCAEQHTSGTFATDYAAGKWVVLSAPRTLASADVTTALTFTPVNKAGDTMTGALVAPTGTTIAGVEFSDALLSQQDLVTLNKGLYSAYNSSASDIIYGFASNVVRDAGSTVVIGAQFSGYGGGAAATGPSFGANINAFGFNGFVQSLIGLEIDVVSFDANNASAKRGLNIIFFNRQGSTPGGYTYPFPFGTYTNAGAGLGSNYYNRDTAGIQIDSAQRSATGEYCGWNKGLFFTEYALDYAINSSGNPQPAIGIDFSELHYYGGADPTIAYRMDAAIALRDLQTIWWNRDPSSPTPTNKVRSYFDIWSGRWVLALEGTERFGIDVNTGDIYQNGALFSGGVSLSGANTWTGINVYNSGIVTTGVTYVGSARRIVGDFSNATVVNRTMAQTSTANQATEFGVLPNGSATACGLFAIAHSSAIAGSVVGRIGADTTGVQVSSTLYGGGAALPLDFAVGASTVMRLNSASQVMMGTTTAPAAVVGLRVAGAIQCDQPVAFSVSKGGVAQNVADATTTVVTFSVEEIDTNANFDTATSRFTPPLGKYHLMGMVQLVGSVDQGRVIAMVYKNGVQFKNGSYVPMSGTGGSGSEVSCLVEANGFDYFELRVFQTNGTATTLQLSGATADTWFAGYKIA
jgi:hypothetical protein